MKNMLMLGLWKYVINVPPFLWHKQIAKGRKGFEKEAGALSKEYRLIHHFVVKNLPSQAGPLAKEIIAEGTGCSVDLVIEALDYLEKRMTFLFRDDNGNVAWAYPVTVAKTPHKVSFSTGEELFAA
jgi:hypothetical protein